MKETTANQNHSIVQRNYKDTVFRMIFREKENLLSLYNALNGTAYENVDDLEITTLENAVYMNYKNDISLVFDFELLLYVAKVLQNRIKDKNLYSKTLIKIPTPRFVVFYNGSDLQPEQQTLYLSDAFEKKQDEPSLEQAVDDCIKNDILADFLSQNRAEAIAVSIFEYAEEKHMKCERAEWREIGRKEGLAVGRKEGGDDLAGLLRYLTEAGKTEEMNKVLYDSDYRAKMLKEYLQE